MKRLEIYSLISGIVFLLSGVAKSLNIAYFQEIIAQYGFENLQILAIFFVLAETLIGLMLIFQIYLRKISLIGILLLMFFTIIFAYGLIFKEIKDCGCFGNIKFLNTSPTFTFTRNILLIGMLLAVFIKEKQQKTANKWAVIVIIIFMCLTAFMSGFSCKNFSGNNISANKFKVKHIKNTALKNFVSTSSDSTYFVFAFTYSCQHCMNSIENLKQYEKFGIADKVIGLALADSVMEKKFIEIFNPDFEIKNIEPKNLFTITNSFPKAFYIKNDSVIAVLSGELPCAFVFDALIK